jgi:hypothetical protein
VGQRRNYYQEPQEDAVVMRVFLPQDQDLTGASAPVRREGDGATERGRPEAARPDPQAPVD